MSSMQNKTMAMDLEECTWEQESQRPLGAKDLTQEKLLDANVKCLLGLGIVPIIIGIVTGIWPIALVSLGPWLLALLDINQRKREKTH